MKEVQWDTTSANIALQFPDAELCVVFLACCFVFIWVLFGVFFVVLFCVCVCFSVALLKDQVLLYLSGIFSLSYHLLCCYVFMTPLETHCDSHWLLQCHIVGIAS